MEVPLRSRSVSFSSVACACRLGSRAPDSGPSIIAIAVANNSQDEYNDFFLGSKPRNPGHHRSLSCTWIV
jgi:hypothetical protein